MIQNQLLSFISAAAMAAGNVANATPVFPDFNSNDVNGSVVVTLPEGMSAKVSITFDSPEGKAEPYYLTNVAKDSSVEFAIEGRDNTEDDYRTYSLTVTPYGEDVMPYVTEFTVPDGNDNPDSFKKLTYTFVIDDVLSDSDWDASGADDITVAYHLNAFTLGDVNNDGKVDAKDASAVLVYYSRMSTGGESTLTEAQMKAANVNGDSLIDAKDASRILVYYAAASTGADPKWD